MLVERRNPNILGGWQRAGIGGSLKLMHKWWSKNHGMAPGGGNNLPRISSVNKTVFAFGCKSPAQPKPSERILAYIRMNDQQKPKMILILKMSLSYHMPLKVVRALKVLYQIQLLKGKPHLYYSLSTNWSWWFDLQLTLVLEIEW